MAKPKIKIDEKIESIVGASDDIYAFVEKLFKEDPVKFAELEELIKSKNGGFRDVTAIIKILDGKCVSTKAFENVSTHKEVVDAGYTIETRIVKRFDMKTQELVDHEVKVAPQIEKTLLPENIKKMEEEDKR